MELAYKTAREMSRVLTYVAAASTNPDPPPLHRHCQAIIASALKDGRNSLTSFWAQAFLVSQQWWHKVTHAVPGITPHHEAVVSFTARQLLDMFSISHSQLQEAL
jgi:polyhydroxyalkanoate synthase